MIASSLWSYLQQASWFNTGANVWQWVMSAFGVPSILAGVYVYWTHRCKVCHVRHGQHPIHGTTWKVCSHHHTQEHHARLFAEHAVKHPDRLGYGRSHNIENIKR